MFIKYIKDLMKSAKSIYGLISFILILLSILIQLLIHKNPIKSDVTPWAIFISFILANYALYRINNSEMDLQINIDDIKLKTTHWSSQLPAEGFTKLSFVINLKNNSIYSIIVNRLDVLNLNLKNDLFMLENISIQRFVHGETENRMKKVRKLPFEIESKRFSIIECEISNINFKKLESIEFAKKLSNFEGCEFDLYFEYQGINGKSKTGKISYSKELKSYKNDIIIVWKDAKRNDLIEAISK